MVSANQLSIHRSVEVLRDEFELQVGPDNIHNVEDQSESMVAPTDVYDLHKSSANDLQRRNRVHNFLPDEARLIKLITDAGLSKTVALG